jgi:ABC transport system ATP-binding/permease protein
MEAEQNAATEITIRFLDGPLAEKTISVQKQVTMIGRDRSNDIVVMDPSVSRRHACIRRLDDSWTIENLSQSSFIAIDQQHMGQGQLQHNRVVNLGEDIRFVFIVQPLEAQPPQPPPATQIAISSPVSPSVPPTVPAGSLLPVNIPPDVSSSSTMFVSPSQSGKQTLTISSNIRSDVQVHLLDKPVLNIGREAKNDIVIAEPTVSAWHAQLVQDGRTLVLVHPHPSRAQTLNGLWYQGRLIRGEQQFRKQLVSGDIFRIGDEHGTLITLTYDDGTGIPVDTLPAMQPIPLTESRLTIGRTPDNTVVLNHPQVSAHHAPLEKVEGGYRVSDTDSTNHVYVNGQLTSEQLLRTGDEMRVGPFRLTYTGT